MTSVTCVENSSLCTPWPFTRDGGVGVESEGGGGGGGGGGLC